MNQTGSAFCRRWSQAAAASASNSSGSPCIVEFPNAQEGDIIVCINGNDWDNAMFSIGGKLNLLPFGRIDSIDRQQRVANVEWFQKAPSFDPGAQTV